MGTGHGEPVLRLLRQESQVGFLLPGALALECGEPLVVRGRPHAPGRRAQARPLRLQAGLTGGQGLDLGLRAAERRVELRRRRPRRRGDRDRLPLGDPAPHGLHVRVLVRVAGEQMGGQLPYTFIVNRLAHYIKVIQRENIGTWKERGDLERELNNWIRQYVADQDNPSPGVRSRRPLRQAEITVSDVEGDPGWYRVNMKVKPHFKYMGASFTLSLVGKLDKK